MCAFNGSTFTDLSVSTGVCSEEEEERRSGCKRGEGEKKRRENKRIRVEDSRGRGERGDKKGGERREKDEGK